MPCTSYPNLIAWTSAQTGLLTPLVIGPPGCGKSKSIEAFAAACGRYLHPLIGSELQPTDWAIPFPGPDGTLKLLVAEWVSMVNMIPSVLFLDEFTTLAPAQQTPMMKTIHERKVGDVKLSDDLWIIAACNPPDCAANASEIEPPLANRIQHLPWEVDYEGWERAMSNGGHFDPPRFVPLPDDWKKHVGKACGLVAAFHKHLPGRLERYPTDRSQASGPWPSQRSWYNGAISMASLAAIDAEPLLRYRALAGCVGEDVAQEYQIWEAALDLPDPEEWMLHARLCRDKDMPLADKLTIPPRCDQVMAVLSSLVDRVKNHNLDQNGKPTAARWLAAVDCMAEVAKTRVELTIAPASALFGKEATPHYKDGEELMALIRKCPQDWKDLAVSIHKNVNAAA
jgi:hypothetical protein